MEANVKARFASILPPIDVSAKSFGRPRAFRVEKARSAPIAVGFAEAR
jgi:hypothetical protein